MSRKTWIVGPLSAQDRCTFCGITKYLTIDHVIPLSRGGEDSRENRQLLCHWCNSKKSNHIIPFQLPMRLTLQCGTCFSGKHGSIDHEGSLTYRAHMEGVL